MANAKNAKIQIEAGQSLVAFEALTDSGNGTVFNPSAPVMSAVEEAIIRPNGIISGVNLLSADAANDTVAVAAFSATSKGVIRSIASTTVGITRPSSDVSKVTSIIMDEDGNVVALPGVDGTDENFSETRGAAGAPPYIPADAVEIGQVRVTTSASAPIDEAVEVFQNGQYTERSDFPVYTVNYIGAGDNVNDAGKINAYVEFSEILPRIHTGDKPKGIYAQYYVPSFADLAKARDFKPAEKSHSVSGEAYYGGSTVTPNESLGQASFTVLLDDGITDMIVGKKNTKLTVKVYSDRNRPAYLLTQGIMAIARSFPVAGQITASVTITSETATAEFRG